MHKIKEIRLKNFKFFYGDKSIPFDRKHVLLYGENGSGKSSIYWALYTFFQSVFKSDPREVQKYFRPITQHPESIKNRYGADNESAFIEIDFVDEDSDLRTKKISDTTVNTRPTQHDKFIEQITLSSDFIDYKSIFNIYNFTNKERVKLFKYFEKNLMPFINLRTPLVQIDGTPRSKNLEIWWEYLKKGITPYPNMHGPGYAEFQNLVSEFNGDLRFYLNSITETANDYLENKFKENIQISFEYEDCVYNQKVNNTRTKKTKAPEIFLTARLLDSNLNEDTNKLNRVHTFLNEAKLSSIALAIRMAILKDKFVATSPKILVLDDLLLSLDMGNREAVLSIVLDEYCNDYQIIFLTHDKVFFQTVLSYIQTFHSNELKKTGESDLAKLKDNFKNHWKVLEMYESMLPEKKKIPVILDYRSSLQKAHYYFSDSNNLDYNACGNNLRAALEEFFRGFIPSQFLRNNDGDPKPANSLTLNPLINCCIAYFTHLGFNISILDQLNRYRERALNQTSHYNPHSNYFKKELQETFEIINLLYAYRTDAIISKDESLQFSVTSQGGNEYVYTFKPLDDIRLYLEARSGAQSFYCINDKLTFGLVGYSDSSKTQLIDHVSNNLSLSEFYEETITGLEGQIGEPCTRVPDVFDAIKTIQGQSLNDLKAY